MAYIRVTPRDLFNEAKLLKCLGQLALHIHDGVRWPLQLLHDDSEYAGYAIDQDESSGSLFCCNLRLLLNSYEIPVSTAYNSKRPYPLQVTDENLAVFNDDGSLSAEVEGYLDTLYIDNGTDFLLRRRVSEVPLTPNVNKENL